MKQLLLAWIFLALLLCGCSGGVPEEAAPAEPAPAVSSPEERARIQAEDEAAYPRLAEELIFYDDVGGDFTLTDHRGGRFELASTHGKIRMLFFGYASCPDVCPQTLSKVARVNQLLGTDAARVVTLLVSVDPERDTPERLADFLGYFRLGNVVALTGARAEIDAVVELFQAEYDQHETSSAAGYLIDHTSFIYLLDGDGRTRTAFYSSESSEKIAAAIRLLLREGAP